MLGERFEKLYPRLLGLAALAFLPSEPWVSVHRSQIAAAIAKLFSPTLNVSAIAVGFLATSQSILISLRDAPGMIKMKSDGYYEHFVDFLSSATSWSFSLAVLSGIFSALDFTRLDTRHGYLQVAWLMVCFITLGSYYRAVSLLPFVLRGTIPRCASKPNGNIKPFDPNA
jgi:hypothetical protein